MRPLEGKAALILEDEPIISFALEDMLLELGCGAVRAASRIEEAAELLRTQRFDFAVLDVNIHGARSYPVADEMSATGLGFIFATGYGEMEHPPRYASVPTITKPYSIDDLAAAIRTALPA